MCRVVFVAIVCFVLLLSACDVRDAAPTVGQADKASSEQPPHRSRTAVSALESTLDIGAIYHGQTATARHLIVNKSDTRRVLLARVGCGCTHVSISPATLEPGDQAVVQVSYDSSVLFAWPDVRSVREVFTLYDRDTGDEVLNATVVGTLKPGLIVTPDRAVVRRPTLKGSYHFPIELQNRTDVALRLTELEVVRRNGVAAVITAEPRERTIGPGSTVTVDLVVVHPGDDPFNTELVIVAEPIPGSGAMPTGPLSLRVPIAASVQELVSVVPATVVFRTVSGAETPPERVRLSPTSGNSLRISAVEVDHPLISATVDGNDVVLRYSGGDRVSGWMTIVGEVDDQPFRRRVRVIAGRSG